MAAFEFYIGVGVARDAPIRHELTRPSATHVAAIHLWLRLFDLEFLHFSMQPFGAPAALAGLGPPRVLMLMLMVIVVVVRSHALGRYCFLLHHHQHHR